MKNRKVFTAILFTVLAWTGCESEKSVTTDEAVQRLEDVLFQTANIEDYTNLDDINFAAANSDFRSAVGANPNDLTANLGAAITEILKVNVEREVRDIRDGYIDYVDTSSLFQKTSFGKMHRRDIPTPLDLPVHPLRPRMDVRDDEVFKKVSLMARVSANNPPLASEVQKVITDKVIPALDYAIARLEVVESDPTYVFVVTPKMQGDFDADPRELDMTEIRAFHSSLLILRATMRMVTAYDFDIADYSAAGVAVALNPGSTFFTLKPQHQLSMARTDLIGAVDQLLAAADFLENETDDQDDDIIKIDPEDIDEFLEDLRRVLNDVKSTMDGVRTFDFDHDSVDVNVKAFFDNPIQDAKAKMPPYQVSVVQNSCGTELFQKFSGTVFPDPTFNGILPGMTNERLYDLFDIDIDTLGRDRLSATIGGMSWEACDAYADHYSPGLYIDASASTNSMWTSLTISIASFDGANSYTLTTYNNGGYMSAYWNGVYYSTDLSHSATVTITEYREEDHLIAGTISGTLVNLSDTLAITNGEFYLRVD